MAEYCEYCMQPVDGAGSCPFCGNNREIANDNWQLQPGTILQGRYLLGRVLGSGGFGVTYIGRDLRLNRRIAVKEYFPKACANRISASSPVVTITDDQSYFAQKGKDSFIREAQALATLPRNLGVVEVYDYFEDNGTAYIVMEYLEGSTLKQLLQHRRFGADELFSLLEPVLEALEAVHRSKLVHRDISPDNLMLCGDGKLVLMDFGAARQVDPDNPLSMTLVVKRGYAPEEQYRSRGEVGPWTDIYALCATIYHCLTGIVPEESVERLAEDTMRWPSELGVAITQRQESVLKKGMAVRARDRYRSVGELREALSAREETETVTIPVQPPVIRAISESDQKKQAWQQVPPATPADPAPIQTPIADKETLLLREKERQQAGIHRIPVAPTASGAQRARPVAASAEAPKAAPTPNARQSYRVPERSEKPEKSVKPEKSPATGKLIALVAALALVLCIAVVLVVTKVVIPNAKYNAAAALMEAGSYEEANAAFEALGGYKDSADQIEKCNAAEKYNAAATLMEAGSYEEAIAAFEALGDYKDSSEQKARALQAIAIVSAAIGDTVTFGSYEQDNDSSNGAEEIEWLVLDRDGDNVLLLSEYALDAMPYNEESAVVTWKTCTLRRWLNDAFYTTAFSSEEQSRIKTTTVTADSNPKYDTSPGNDTEDKVFLLSISEADKYFTSDEERKCGTTDYAIANGAYMSDSNTAGGKATCCWWLRSPGFNSNLAAYVNRGGFVDTIGGSVSHGHNCIRPALWVNLAS